MHQQLFVFIGSSTTTGSTMTTEEATTIMTDAVTTTMMTDDGTTIMTNGTDGNSAANEISPINIMKMNMIIISFGIVTWKLFMS